MTPSAHPATTTLARLLFFGWNALFLCIIGAGFVPVVWWNLMQDGLQGLVPLDFVIFSNVAILIPVASTLLGLKLWRSPWRLMRLFYCVELTLFSLCLYRLFGIHELTLGTGWLFGFVALGALAQLHRSMKVATSAGAWRYLELAMRTVSLAASAYTALLASFFVLPTAFLVVEVLTKSMFLFLPVAFFGLSALVLCLWPVVSIIASVRGFGSSVRLIMRSRSHGLLRAAAVSSVTLALIAASFAALPPQPQRVAREVLWADGPTGDDDRIRQLEREEEVRDGLVNAYLARYRYVADRRTTEGAVRSAWWHTVGVPLEWAEALQGAWNWLVAPLLYDGEIHEDRAWAVTEYARFFDQPIERAERAAILAAISATFRREDREAGLLDVDRRRVLLLQQSIEVREHAHHAEVEIHEVYENQTYDQEEIAYYFSLPESAVITGLWLGETEDPAQRYRFVVAPRGAAQAVYKAEVQRRVDPALLEQVGPRQYRLRAFPIPPRPYRSNVEKETPRMHLWLTYRTFAQDGKWPLPELLEKRNVFFDDRTERSLNGRSWSTDEEWMPTAPLMQGATSPVDEHIPLGTETVVRVRTLPESNDVRALSGRHLVIVDRSYSMRTHAAALQTAVRELEASVSTPAQLQYVLGPTHDRPQSQPVSHLDPREIVFFGSARSADLIEAAATQFELGAFDGVFVLTDEGSYETETDAAKKRDLGLPLYWVHLGGRLPRAYDDTTIETIHRRGGAAVTTIREALRRYEATREMPARFVAAADGFVFELVDGKTGRAAPDSSAPHPLAPFAARQLISGAMRTGPSSTLADLDRMHALAKKLEIVTPYSSMLVLVEDRQREALAQAEKSEDRFDREVEDGLEHGGPNITGTPEPEEWALFFVGLGLAYFASRRRRSAPLGSWAH